MLHPGQILHDVFNLITVTTKQQLFKWKHVAKFPWSLSDVQDAFKSDPVINKWLLRLTIYIHRLTKMLKFSSEASWRGMTLRQIMRLIYVSTMYHHRRYCGGSSVSADSGSSIGSWIKDVVMLQWPPITDLGTFVWMAVLTLFRFLFIKYRPQWIKHMFCTNSAFTRFNWLTVEILILVSRRAETDSVEKYGNSVMAIPTS